MQTTLGSGEVTAAAKAAPAQPILDELGQRIAEARNCVQDVSAELNNMADNIFGGQPIADGSGAGNATIRSGKVGEVFSAVSELETAIEYLTHQMRRFRPIA